MPVNKYWLYLEKLRRSGVTNMFGAVPYLQEEFGLTPSQAKRILLCWMESYNPADYEETRTCCKCGKKHLTEGFYLEERDVYYCSEDCLYQDYTKEEIDQMYEEEAIYWTEWDD